MKRRKTVIVFTLFGLLVLLSGLVGTGFGIVHSAPPYEFAAAAQQDGYWTSVLETQGVVHRFYMIDEDADEVLARARAELSESDGWKEVPILGGVETVFSQGDRSVHVRPNGESRTSIVVARRATYGELLVGSIHEDIPDRYSSWR